MLGMHGWGFLIVPAPFLLLWVISRGEWIGFGDVELMACAGILLGISGGFSSVMLAFWIATLVILPWVGVRKILRKKFSHTVPFGPFLLLGMYLVGIVGVDVFKLVASVLQ
jgi:prepilin signal peptidase PulO-like enzyme (type II secretory pathway)